MDEGDGFNGISSVAASKSMKRPNIPYWDIIDHVAFNPKITSLISTTPELGHLLQAAIKAVEVQRLELYIVKIDARQLR